MQKTQRALRKAAVLIASLDANSADTLLDQMSPEQAARVRNEVLEIGEIPLDEQNAVIGEFLSGGGHAELPQPEGIEIDDSLARKIALSRDSVVRPRTASVAQVVSPPEPEKPPFRFLHEAAVDTLCRFLEREQPQTIAVVVSHLPPDRAAEVVTQLPPALRADVLKRVAELDRMDQAVLHDLEQELQSLLAAQTYTVPQRSAGLVAVSAILDAMDSGDRKDALAEIAARDAGLAANLGRSPPAAGSWEPAPQQHEPVMTLPSAGAVLDANAHEEAGDVAPAIDFDFADVEQLDHRSLALLFHETDSQVALLALTGAERPFVERILRQLPAKDAKALRRKLHELGPLRLSDVEEAQQELAATAGRLAGRGVIPLPKRRLAMAA